MTMMVSKASKTCINTPTCAVPEAPVLRTSRWGVSKDSERRILKNIATAPRIVERKEGDEPRVSRIHCDDLCPYRRKSR